MKVLTSSQMFSAEQAQVNRGMSFTRLMENAGSACARAVRERFASLEQSRGSPLFYKSEEYYGYLFYLRAEYPQ